MARSDAGLRVLHLAAPAAVGGAESVLRQLASGFRRRGHDARVLATAEPEQDLGPFRDGMERAGVPLEVLRLPARAYLREGAGLVRRCRQLEPDVLHTHGFRSDTVAAAASPFLRARRVATVHGWIGSTGGSGRIRLYEGIQRMALRGFDRVVAVSSPVGERLVRAGVPSEKVRRVRNAYRSETEPMEREAARRELGVGAGAFLVGFVGRLSREKGVDVLLEALSGLDEVPWRASLVGDGPAREALERQTRELRMEPRVRFHGRVPDASRLFPAFDVFALSSRTEGTPVVLLEAMDAGVPVVATRVGGVPDVVGREEALLIPPEDPAALRRVLRRVHERPGAAKERAANARRRLHTDFAMESWLDRYESIYRGVLAPRSRAEEREVAS